MKNLLFETAPAAILVGVEAFGLGFGAAWLALTSIFPVQSWLWPAVIVGTAFGAWSILMIFRVAIKAANADEPN